MGVVEGWQGRFFEDFEVGDVYRSSLGRTVTKTDNIWFTNLTLNTNQAHFNAQVGADSEFGRMIVASPLTISIVLTELRPSFTLTRVAVLPSGSSLKRPTVLSAWP